MGWAIFLGCGDLGGIIWVQSPNCQERIPAFHSRLFQLQTSGKVEGKPLLVAGWADSSCEIRAAGSVTAR